MLAGLPSEGEKSEHMITNKSTKMKDLSKKRVSTGTQFEDFRRKKEQKQISRPFKNTQWNTRPLNTTIEWGPGNQAESYEKKKKAFRLELLELCKTRAKKSSPITFNFYVILAGHEMVTDASRAVTCWRMFKASSLQAESTKNG